MNSFRLIITAIIFTLSLTIVESYQAAAFTVINTNDSGAGSLRQAILDANVNSQDDTIDFDPAIFSTPQLITLTSGDLFISSDGGFGNTKSLTINGTGADKLTISGNNHSRVFRTDLYGKVVINSVKITGGNGTNNGQIPEINSVGGGIAVGGGYIPDGSQNLILTNSIVSNNQSIISFASAGGIAIGGRVTIINSAVINNISTEGAGITIRNADVNIINSTVSHNSGGFIAGIRFHGGNLYLTNSTVAFNRSTNSESSGIWVIDEQFSPARFFPRNSIIAKNTGNINFGNDVWGQVRSRGNNIFGNTIGTSFLENGAGDQLNVDPQLDVNPGANGGVIPNHAFGAASTAIDGGNNCVLNTTANGGCSDPNITTDARGIFRPQDGNGDGTATVDVGAFEATRAEVAGAPSAAPDLQAASDSGISNTDNITANTNLTFNVGGVTSGTTVELLRDGTAIASTIAASGSVVLSDSGATNGVHVYTSRQIIGGVTSLSGAPVSITVDTVAPVASVNQATGQADPTRTQPINYSVVFSETVTDFTASDISFADSTANVSSAIVTITGSNLNYNIAVSNITTDGTIVVSFPANGMQDIAGNPSLPSTANDNTVTFDSTAPTVTINQSATQTDPTNVTPIRFTVVFSEPVTGFAATDVSLAGSTANVSSANKTITGSGATYTVSISNVFANGATVVAAIPLQAAADTAGNLSAASTSTDNSVTIDNVAPTVTINQANGQLDPTNALPVNYTVVFSELVTGFDTADISLSGSTLNTAGAIVSVTGSGSTYNVAVGGNLVSNNGILRASVRFNAATDAIGNSNSASTSTDNSVRIDNVRPTVNINQATGQSDPTSNQPISFTVVFSESVIGFTASDVSLAGSTANVSSAVINVTGNANVYTVTVGNITSSGQVTASIGANAAQDALGNLSLASTATDNTVTVNVRRSFIDFDGDGKTDLSIFRPSLGEWWYLKSSDGSNAAFQFGSSSDKLTPSDFTGDGKTDAAFFRPSTGEWFVLRSEDSSFYSFPFGTDGDIPAPADFDGDGKSDAAVFRPSTATWYISKSTGGTLIQQFGQIGDYPVVADYDGDGKSDIAIYRPSAGEWWIQKSSNGGTTAFQFGSPTDKPVQADYTGDSVADIAFWRPSTGEWFILRSENLSYYSFPFGANGDVPATGDYDGDGKFDATVFRPSSNTWYSQRSTAGTLIQDFGQTGDIPVPSAFVP